MKAAVLLVCWPRCYISGSRCSCKLRHFNRSGRMTHDFEQPTQCSTEMKLFLGFVVCGAIDLICKTGFEKSRASLLLSFFIFLRYSSHPEGPAAVLVRIRKAQKQYPVWILLGPKIPEPWRI